MGPRGFVTDTVLLLMLDEERGTFAQRGLLRYALSASLIADLAVLHRVRVGTDAVSVEDDRRTGHALVDERLARITAGPSWSAFDWIVAGADGSLIDRVTERLLIAGTLASRTDRVLGILPARRYQIVPPRLRITLRAHVRGVVLGDAAEEAPELVAAASVLAAMGEVGLLAAHAHADRAEALVRADPVAAALARALARTALADDASAVGSAHI